jgi:hypothetical protein
MLYLPKVSGDERMANDLKSALHFLWGVEAPSPYKRGPEAVEALQSRYRLVLPKAFAAYLRDAAPSADLMHDRRITWWAPRRIRSLRDECGSETPRGQFNHEIEEEANFYLVFADYLDWCYAYAICCSDGPNRGRIALIGAQPDRFVASSFPTFVRLAAVDSDRLHSPAGDHLTDLA